MERLIASYGSTYQISSVVVRLFSVYGPGLKKQLIWDLCEKLRSFDGAPVVLGGHGSEKRDWIYVEDAVRLIVQAEAMCNPQTAVINGGNGVGVPISKVADLIIREWESDVAVKFSKECRPGDPQCLIADVGLATQAGFQPRISLEEGIKRTVDWVKVGGQ
jgi:UDP-glucose 4-epimerase